jgi:hypothetical protein
MARSLAVDTESDVVRGVAMGLAFLVGLALNLNPGRRVLALAVFGGGAAAFFGLAALAAIDDEYASPRLRWSLFAAWGVLLFAVGVWTESAVGGIGGAVVAVYAVVRAWLFGALDESTDVGDPAPGAEPAPTHEESPAVSHSGTADRAPQGTDSTAVDDAANDDRRETVRERENGG